MAVIGQIGGAFVGGMLADAIGRKKSMVLIAVGYAVFALLDAFSVSMPMLLTARLLIGVTIGVSVVVVPVYVAELAPAAMRGSLATAYQLAIVSGIILGYLAGYLLADTHSWRWIFGLAAILAMLLLPLLIRMPETARWYVLKGRVDDARRALLRVEPEARVERGAGRDRQRPERSQRPCQKHCVRDAAAALSAGHHFRDHARRSLSDLGHQRDHLLQPTDIRNHGLHRQFRAAGAAGNSADRRVGGGVRRDGSRRPTGPAPNPVVRHRHDDHRRRLADRRLRPWIRA